MQYGCLMLDVAGAMLTSQERTQLQNPHVGGLILFSRNYQNRQQLAALVQDIRLANPAIVIAVDHEGGRVQRFRQGFCHLPPMRALSVSYMKDSALACQQATELGYLMAAELVAVDIDISFAPVLDLDWANSSVIGDRSFGESAQQVIDLCAAFMAGMQEAGMSATGKHFPGHGWAIADSHLEQAIDERSSEAICAADLRPFKALIEQGLSAVMPAHVIYPKVDANPCGFSAHWLQTVLRGDLQFDGIIFSDDLNMNGARLSACFSDRAEAALNAGCDTVLVCNNPKGAAQVLAFLDEQNQPLSPRLGRMRHQKLVLDQVRMGRARNLAAELLNTSA